jgi:hypothetical protein
MLHLALPVGGAFLCPKRLFWWWQRRRVTRWKASDGALFDYELLDGVNILIKIF